MHAFPSKSRQVIHVISIYALADETRSDHMHARVTFTLIPALATLQ